MPFGKNRKRYKVYAAVFLCMAILGIGFLVYERMGEKTQPQFAVIPNDRENLFLFAPGTKGGLEKKALEVRATLSERAKADFLFQELRKAKAIPATAKLQELAFGEDGVLYLDVSRGLIEQQLDARGEIRVAYALINTFVASFREINRVQLLVDGRPLYTLFGVVYTYAPLPFNSDLQEE
jgi:hypothetical protein